MRLLFDAHHLGHRQTGNETWTRNMIPALAALLEPGEVEYAVTAEGLEHLRRLTDGPAHVVSAASPRRLAIDLPALARRTRSDVILAQYTHPLSTTPCVLVVHDLSPEHAESAAWLPARTRLRFRLTVGRSCRRAAHVITVSGHSRDDIIERYRLAPESVTVVANAVDGELERLLAGPAGEPPERAPGFTVLAVGNLLPRKNLVMLARAVAGCRSQGSEMVLRLIGNHTGAGAAVAAEVRRQLGAAVEITGYLPPELLAGEYRRAGVVCMPSLFEGFGFPIIEAMAAGRPVLVSDATCLPEIAGDAALVIPARDTGAWTGALRRLESDPQLRDRLSAMGAARARSFSWQASAQVLIGILRRVSGRRAA